MAHNVSSQWVRPHGKLLLAVSMDPREVGKRIAEARNDRGWTQLQFALEADVSPSSIQRWEAGQLPPVRELLRIAEVLGVDPERLVEPPLTSPRPSEDLLRQVAAGISELAETEKELLERIRDIQERVVRIEGHRGKPAASQAP